MRDNTNARLDRSNESVRHESAIASLSARSDASLDEIRGLYSAELARLRLGATVHTYLPVLTLSKVRSILRRTGRVRRS